MRWFRDPIRIPALSAYMICSKKSHSTLKWEKNMKWCAENIFIEEAETSYHHQGSNLLLFFVRSILLFGIHDRERLSLLIFEQVAPSRVRYKLTGCHFYSELIIYDINLLSSKWWVVSLQTWCKLQPPCQKFAMSLFCQLCKSSWKGIKIPAAWLGKK